MPPEQKNGREQNQDARNNTPPPRFSEKAGGAPLVRGDGEERREGELRPIRTYESDVEEVLKKEKISLAGIALEEAKRERTKPPPAAPIRPEAPKRLDLSFHLPQNGDSRRLPTLRIAGGVAALLVFGGAAWFLLARETPAPEPPREVPSAAVKPVGAITLQGKEAREAVRKAIRDAAAALPVPEGTAKSLALRTEEGEISTERLFALLEARAPAALLRALDERPTLGVMGVRNNTLFLLFTVNAFDRAFDGMLQFEKTLLADVGPLFGQSEKTVRGGSASTTAETLGGAVVFKDVIIRNRDARAIFNQNREIVFLYSFLDHETLLITGNEETLKLLLSRTSRGRLR